jgi:MFS family permease
MELEMVSKTDNSEITIYGYRWVVLLVFSIVTLIIQLQWLTFAPIASEAQLVYNVSAMQIDMLSIIFMVVFLIVCIPASYIIDTYGMRIGIGIGAVLTGVFGLMKGIYATDYTMVIIAQIGLAIAQPFIINAATKVAVHWFPVNERATAVGIATLSQFTGIIIAMIATPLLITVKADGVYDLKGMLMIYGIISVVGAIIFLIFSKEYPPTPPGEENEDERFDDFFEGIKHIFKHRDMVLTLLIFFIGLGMFNAVSTCIDKICEQKNLTMEQTGIVGGIMLIAGIVGAVILPPISDKLRKRKIFIILAMALSIPGLIGLTIFDNYTLVLISSGTLGFFLLGAGAPVGFQYAAEVSYPAPESSSQGLMLLAGQISGIIFIVGMNMFGMTPFLVAFIILTTVNVFVAMRLKESKIFLTD